MSSLPLVGSVEAIVTAVADALIHGDRYHDLALATDRGRVAVRVAAHAAPRRPAAGDRVRVHLVLGQVDRLEFLAAGPQEG